MIRFCQAVLIATSAIGLALASAQAAEPASTAKKTNVLFIVADDLGCSLGCYGDPDVRSPNIDRLAARGMHFEHAYCQYPVCNPSRSSFLTGLRPDATKILENTIYFRDTLPSVVTLPQLFRENGYFTASLGKIFHDAASFPQDEKSWVEERHFKETPAGLRGERRNLTNGALDWCYWIAAEGSDEDQADGQIAAEAVRLIEAHRDGPFFLGVGFHKPHNPYSAPKRYFDLYPLDQVRLTRDPDDRTPDKQPAIPGGPYLAAFSKFTDHDQREFHRAYRAGISFMDAQVGKLLDTLERLGLWENTIVVFLGDHGYHQGEHGWWSKFTLFELCARAPLIVWAPGEQGMGKSTAGLVEFIDIYPTIAGLCGLEPPDELHGKSFRHLLDDPTRPGKPAAYTQMVRGKFMGRSVRTNRWRYTEWDGGSRGVELYDHTNDPLEYYNLAGDARHAVDVAEMKRLLRAGAP